MMQRLSFLLVGFWIISIAEVSGWGKTGHRVVGQVAYNHLTKKAKKNIQAILGKEHLGMVGNYMDFIRADKKYDHMTPWHYCTIPNGMIYEEAGTPDEGDVIITIQRLVSELKSKNFTDKDELFALKCLVHLVGDIHQPLHVGNGEDAGGNQVKVKFLWRSLNLHSLWDSGLIDHQQLSYSEYTKVVDVATKEEISKWQSEGIMVWVDEAISYRPTIYDIPDDGKLGYQYNYVHLATVNERLLKAGIRLAGILNEIYGS